MTRVWGWDANEARRRRQPRTAGNSYNAGDQPSELLSPEAFPDTRPDPVEREVVDGIPAMDTGPNSRTARARLASRCAGWPVPPEEAYTWPLLVAALHRAEAGNPALNELLNGFEKADWANRGATNAAS